MWHRWSNGCGIDGPVGGADGPVGGALVVQWVGHRLFSGWGIDGPVGVA